jgi:uncharacterized membrane protein
MQTNVGKTERGASIIAGTLLAYRGLREGGWKGAGLAFLGINFLRRGLLGYCYTYRFLGIDTNHDQKGRNQTIAHGTGIRVDEAITIDRPRHEAYAFWSNPENLAQFMEHVESVRAIDLQSRDRGGVVSPRTRTHWVAKGPGGRRMEWDAEIINQVENELIAWRSLEGSEVPNAGSVRFTDAAGGRGTEVRIALQYNPPGGTAGAFIAKLFGEDPSTQIHNDLQRLKTRLEAGEVPTVDGQPKGANKVDDDLEHHRKSEQVVSASEASFPASDAPAYSH